MSSVHWHDQIDQLWVMIIIGRSLAIHQLTRNQDLPWVIARDCNHRLRPQMIVIDYSHHSPLLSHSEMDLSTEAVCISPHSSPLHLQGFRIAEIFALGFGVRAQWSVASGNAEFTRGCERGQRLTAETAIPKQEPTVETATVVDKADDCWYWLLING